MKGTTATDMFVCLAHTKISNQNSAAERESQKDIRRGGEREGKRGREGDLERDRESQKRERDIIERMGKKERWR